MAINNQINISLDAKDNASSKFEWLSKSAWGFWSKLKWLWGPLKALWVSLWALGVAAWAAWYKMFGIAENVELTVNKAKIVFWDYYAEMQKFADETGKAMWLSRGEYLKAAAGIQDLLIPMWFTREEATKNTQELMSLSWALAEWSAWQYNAAQVWEIFASAMLGEREQLKSLGISISAEEVSLRALENAKKWVTFATEQQAQAYATQQLIFEKSTDAQTAYANWADSLTRKKQEMIVTLWNLKETLATALIPAFWETVKAIQPIIEKVAKNIELWFQNKENVEKLTTTIKSVIQVFWTLFGILWTAIWLLYKLWEALWFWIFKVVEFVWAVRSKFEEFWNIISQKWNWIKDTSLNVWWAIKNWIVWIADSIYTSVTGKFTALIDKVSAIYEKVKWFLSWILWVEQKASTSAAKTQSLKSQVSYSWAWSTVSWARANWGDVEAWKTYVVWERWRELFTPSTNGTITSNGKSSWAWVNLYFGDVNISNWQTESQFFEKVKRTMIEVQRTSSLWF